VLTRFDDYPVHQMPEPVAHAGTGDRNFYDRYFFNGYDRKGELFFAAALGLYPNRRVMDAAFSVVRAGVQHVLRASRLAPVDASESETTVGPITVEVLEPLRTLRVRVDPNPHGLEADLVFRARTAPIEEPRFTRRVDGRLFMDVTRLTQFGAWEGTVGAGGERIAVDAARVLGSRDRSWGVRPVGEPESGPAPTAPQFFWLWAPINFDDRCIHFDVNEDADGRRWHANGNVVPVGRFAPSDVSYLDDVAHRVRWAPGTRRAQSAELTLGGARTPPIVVALEPILTFQMLGLGYLHPEWGHGMWKGPDAMMGEHWTLADLDPMDPRHLHVQQLCRATTAGAREGVGVLEQLVIGPHAPSGFTSILDPAR
jgi:hypothetical protein